MIIRTQPIAFEAMLSALHKVLGMNMEQAADTTEKLIKELQRYRVYLMPEALLNSATADGKDPFLMLGEMAQAIEETWGRKPWLPE